MQFQQSGNIIRVGRTTGPTHNFLELELDESGGEPLVVEAVSHPSDAGGYLLEEREVVRFVLSGYLVAARNRAALPRIRRIRYVATDSPPESVYEDLARTLVEHFFPSKVDLAPASARPKSDPSKTDLVRVVQTAIEDFLSGKIPAARCPHCGSLVEIEPVGPQGQAWRHRCDCGACSGNLKGI